MAVSPGTDLDRMQDRKLRFGRFKFLGHLITSGSVFPYTGILARGDQQGDSWIGYFKGRFRCVYHATDIPGRPGIVYMEQQLPGDIRRYWSSPVAGNGYAIQQIPMRPHSVLASLNVDTPCCVKHPDRDELEVFFGARPGNRPPWGPPLGWWDIIMKATGKLSGGVPLTSPGAWTVDYTKAALAHGGLGPRLVFGGASWEQPFVDRNANGQLQWRGGTLEPSVLWDPDLGHYVMFYSGFTSNPTRNPSNPATYLNSHHHRLGRAISFDGIRWQRTPDPSPTSYVWSADDEPAGPMIWGNTRIPHHFDVSRAPDGVYHMVMIGSKYDSNGNTLNKEEGIGHWYSVDQGFTWTADKDNPLFTWARMASPVMGGRGGTGIGLWTVEAPNRGVIRNDKLGSPNLFWDPVKPVVYLAFDGGPKGLRAGFAHMVGVRIDCAVTIARQKSRRSRGLIVWPWTDRCAATIRVNDTCDNILAWCRASGCLERVGVE